MAGNVITHLHRQLFNCSRFLNLYDLTSHRTTDKYTRETDYATRGNGQVSYRSDQPQDYPGQFSVGVELLETTNIYLFF